jgi:RNA polymerase sigma factor (sigma-70 family)
VGLLPDVPEAEAEGRAVPAVRAEGNGRKPGRPPGPPWTWERYRRALIYYGLRRSLSSHDAEDMAQDVIWKLLKAGHGVPAPHPAAHAYASAKNWTISWSLNRQVSPVKTVLSCLAAETRALKSPWLTDDLVARRETDEDLLAALRALPQQYRRVLTLVGQGFSVKEIASREAISLSNARVRIHRARRQLRAAGVGAG